MWLARKARNQADILTSFHLSSGPDIGSNGEALLISALSKGLTVFVDVGGNAGDWAAAIVEHCAPSVRGLIFEPGRIAEQLRERFPAARFPSIGIHEIALSDSEGILPLFDGGASVYNSLVSNGANSMMVKVARLDAMLETAKIDHVDLLKIDVEGFDAKALRGASAYLDRGAIAVIQFEYGREWIGANENLWSAIQFLRSRGYSVYSLNAKGLHTFNYHAFGEFYCFTNFVAVHRTALDRVSRLIVE